MFEFLIGYLLGSAAGQPEASMSDGEALFLGVTLVVLLLVGVPGLVRLLKRSL
ncbi:conserved hypothetical protein [Cupriavidus taiwanensis]|uniref:hypothetical protein n=1 Tax=Cupriavidus taiwanensis TaxID=164546 RepID=UPI000E11990E|nr:hypothetical protein [Cupriavidus taiwanensis]SPA23018.1 conserved hypothetical protein [Cupriavidus taiwanensis]